MLQPTLPAVNDLEGERIPQSMSFVIDSHVHIFPDAIFFAIRDWFRKFAWPIRYEFSTREVLEFLFSRGIDHIVALQYAHRPGIARDLNSFMKEQCDRFSNVVGMATVFPGEKDAALVLRDAFQDGLDGVKLHAHVQCFDMNSKEMDVIYDTCAKFGKPLVMHVSREPKSPAYACDPYELCSSEKLERVLKEFPDLKICVPHLGTDEYSEYRLLIERYDNLWLDTTMVLADYFPGHRPPPLRDFRPDRIMYGTDFPNIPFAWDRELKRLENSGLPEKTMELILGKNAVDFFSIGFFQEGSNDQSDSRTPKGPKL